jgi:site-specific recombinase XerD
MSPLRLSVSVTCGNVGIRPACLAQSVGLCERTTVDRTGSQTATSALDFEDLGELLKDWRRNLYARNRAPRTVNDYLASGEMFRDWLVDNKRPTQPADIRRKDVEDYLVDLSSRQQLRYSWKPVSAATVAKHYRNLQQLFRFLVHEEILERSPFEKMSPPAVPVQPVPVLSPDEIRRLLDTCAGSGFLDRRDAAIIRLFLDTGMRVSELCGIAVSDLDFRTDTATVTGKGRRSRVAVFGPKTVESIRRYMRTRSRHPKAALNALWLAEKGALTHHGVRDMLTRRGEMAEVQGVHPHRFRHTFAHYWLSAGGNETDLMRLAGWRSREMLARYGASAADERAREAHKRMTLGDW